MSITGISSQTALAVQAMVDLRRQLDDLQRQLGTGQKSDTYAGVGLDRGLAVGLRQHLSALSAFDDAITNVGVRINLAQSTLGSISDIGHTMKSTALQTSSVDSSGSTIAQKTAFSQLSQILDLLNAQAGDRYLFSGRGADQPAVETLDHILNGDGTRAGLKQLIAERNLADLGTSGLGRLNIASLVPGTVTVDEDAVSPFGFKLAGVSSTLTGATVTGPAGVPAGISVSLASNPNNGENIQFRFTLPDGSSENITLTATTTVPPGINQFAIGPNATATAGNLLTALTAAVSKLASTSLAAASAMAASDNFFNTNSTTPPLRVNGPPFDTATSLVAGTPADTVFWYTGEDGPDPARGTATAQVDPSITVSYGVRANEQGIRWVLQNVAALAAVTYSPTDPNATARSVALGQRVATALDIPPGTQKVEDIEAELAGAQTTLASAGDRHKQTKNTLADMLQQIEGIPTEQVAAQILALQTRLQASMQATSLLYRTSLVNYI